MVRKKLVLNIIFTSIGTYLSYAVSFIREYDGLFRIQFIRVFISSYIGGVNYFFALIRIL